MKVSLVTIIAIVYSKWLEKPVQADVFPFTRDEKIWLS